MKSMFHGRWATAVAVIVATIQSHAAACIGLSENAAGWWQGDSLQDAITRGGGTFRGTAAVGGGFAGSGFNLDGGTDALQLPADFKLRSQDFAIEAWIKRSSESISSRDVEAGEFFANSNNGLAFGLTHDGRLYLSHIGVVSFFGTTAIRDTNWNHVAMTREGGILRFYTNGVPATATSCPVVFNLDGPYAIGGLGAAYGGAFYGFLGSIDEIAAYNRALSASEIAAIHQAGAAGKCPTGPGNLIVNGGFETPAYSAADGVLPNSAFVRTRTLPGWEVAPGDGAVDVELKQFGGTSSHGGTQCLDLEGAENLGAYYIRQTVSTVPGKSYRLRFAYAKNPAQPQSRMKLELTGANVGTQDFELAAVNSRVTPGWQPGSVDFVAEANSVRVQFTGTSPAPGFGMLLDDVTLTEVQKVQLANATATYSQVAVQTFPAFPVSQSIDGIVVEQHNGWAIYPHSGAPETAVWETAGDVGYAGGSELSFKIQSLGYLGRHGLGRFRLSATSDPRSEFADGLTADGDVSANWTVLGIVRATTSGTTILTPQKDGSLLASGEQPYSETYFIDANCPLPVITGIRLEALPDPSLPKNGPGRDFEGNFIISEFEVAAAPIITDGPGEICFAAPAGLVAWYRGEDSTSDDHGQHPTIFAAPRYAPGKVGRAFDFDGSNEVVIPDAPDLNFTAFSAEAWVYPTAVDGDVDIIMNKEVNGFDTIAFEFGIKGPFSQNANSIPTGNLAVFLGGLNGMPSDYSGWSDGGANVPLNAWSHIVVSYGNGVARVYLNGTVARTFTGLTGTLRTVPGPLKLGSRSDAVLQGGFTSSRFNGRIDEVSLYSRALEAGEVMTLHQAGSAGKCVGVTCAAPPANLATWLRGEGDASDWTFAHPGTFAAPKFAPGKVGQSFDFDGSNEVVLGDAADFNRDTFTLEAWIYPTSLDGAVDMIANKEAGTDFSHFQFEIGLKGPINEVTSQIPLGNVAFYLGGITGLPDEFGGWVDGKAAAPLNQWTHVALAVEPGAVTVFVNGVATRQLTGLGGTLRTTAGQLKLGSRHEGFTGPRPTERFNGRIDEFSFYTRRLADAEIAAIHAAGEMGKCFRDAPPGDLELVLEAPAKVALDQEFVVTAKLINHGIAPATQVTLTNTVPLGVSVGGVTNSQGSSVNLAGFVISNLGTIGGGQTASVEITCRPLLSGNYTVSGAIGRAEADPVPANDRQSVTFEALPLTLALGDDPSARENDGVVRVPVVLSATSAGVVEATYRLVDGTAKSGVDFLGTNGVVRIAAGATEAFIEVPLVNDRYFESAETFSVELAAATTTMLGRTNAVVTITNDDAKPTLAVSDVVVREGHSGGTNAVFTVTLMGGSEAPATVDFATVAGTASSPTDFVAASGTLTFGPGDSAKTVEVRVNGDTAVEGNESFQIYLSNAANADLADSFGAGVILNDDFVPGQLAAFRWDPVAGSPTVGENVPVRLTAVDGGGNPVPGFDGVVQLGALPARKHPTSLVISEVDTSSPSQSSVEFSNVSTNVLDLTGWTIWFYDSTTWPLPRGSVSLSGGTSLPPAGVFRISEGPITGTFPNLRAGFPLVWGSNEGPNGRRVAVLLRDANGRVADFFCAMRAYPHEITMPVSIPPEEWTGLPMVETASLSASYQRSGNRDNDNARDWATPFPTPLRLNPLMSAVFVDAQPLPLTPEVAMNFVNGVWSGNIQLSTYVPQPVFFADDGNGHIGYSSPIQMDSGSDLSVRLEAPLEGVGHPAQSVHYRATVSSLGETVSSNVVVEVRLPNYFGAFPSAVANLNLSQGTSQFGAYLPVGTPPQAGLLITWRLGDLGINQSATLEFEISRSLLGAAIILPSSLVATATVSRTQPELFQENNTSQATFEVNSGCITIPATPVLWLGPNGAFVHMFGNLGPTNSPPASPLSLGPEQDFSVEFRMRAESDFNRDRIILLDKRDTHTGVGFVLLIDQGRLAASLTDADGNTQSVFTRFPSVSVADLRDGRWHHVGLSVARSPQDRRLALSLDGTATVSSQPLTVVGDLGTASLRMGFEGEVGLGTIAFAGRLDEVTLYRTALSAAQLQSIARAGAAGKCLAEVTAEFITPQPVDGIFPAPLSYGRPTPVSLLITNRGPLLVPVTSLAFGLSELGSIRLLTEPRSTIVVNPLTTYHDFGPLAAGAGVVVELETVLTNIPNVLRADFAGWFQLLNQSYRLRSASGSFRINPDGDADGAADMWELANGFDPLNAADATADTDGDGFPNVDEFQLGTDPRSATDVLKLELSAADANGVRFRFPGKAGKSYGLFRRANLGDSWSEVARFTATENAMAELADTSPPADAAFYQIQLLPNP